MIWIVLRFLLNTPLASARRLSWHDGSYAALSHPLSVYQEPLIHTVERRQPPPEGRVIIGDGIQPLPEPRIHDKPVLEGLLLSDNKYTLLLTQPH